MRNLISKTVFNRIPDHSPADKILAVLFHRSAATIYFIYASWGVVSYFGVIPTLSITQGSFFQQVFSLGMFFTSIIAAFGATFFPKTGRTELFAGLGVTTLLSYYILSLFYAGFIMHDASKIPAAVYGASHLVVPIARSVFIYLTLVKTANPNPKDYTNDSR